ncbi:hypothetical protein CRUP_018415 [Coryphaenoides rupestris]|nr:hypothetical protein CRUP_018415 [Coryphaenoides rupestris]
MEEQEEQEGRKRRRKRRRRGDNPSTSANLLSKIFFCWLSPLFRVGYERRLEEEDMFTVLPEDGSERLGKALQRYWDEEVLSAKQDLRPPKLTTVLIRCYWKSYSLIGIYIFIEAASSLATAYGCVAGVCGSTVAMALLHHLYFYHVQRAGMKIRIAALRLNSAALTKTTTGQIVNLLSNDVNKFDEVTSFLHFLWLGPLQATAAMLLLLYLIGPSCLAGMVVLVVLIPMQTAFGRLFSTLRAQTATLTDDRIRIMSEVVSGIRIIKMYAWEMPFAELVNEVRRYGQ